MAIPLAPSVEYTLHLTKILILRQEGIIIFFSYERRIYEPVDVRSLYWAITHKSTESSTQRDIVEVLISPRKIKIEI